MNQIPLISSRELRKGDMLYRTLGRTGERFPPSVWAGFILRNPGIRERQHSSGALRHRSWHYVHGQQLGLQRRQSEVRMGKALKDGYRQKVFLMTKIDGRTKEIADARSKPLSNVCRLTTSIWCSIMRSSVSTIPIAYLRRVGPMKQFWRLRKAGKIRYIGFTGHKDPHIHLYMLKVAADHGFHFDTVQMPLNVMDAHFRSFGHMVVPELVKQEIGVLGMKSMGDGVILKSKVVSPIECLHYALSLPTSVVITGIDKPEILDQAVEAAKTFKPMTREQIAQLLSRTKEVAMAGKYELFKTSSHFDSTAKHPDWLGGDVPSVQELAPPTA